MKALIQELKSKILSGSEISFEKAFRLAVIEDADTIDLLSVAAREIMLHFRPPRPDLCTLINAKSYLCSEDCGFCSQSARYKTGVKRYPLMNPEEIVQIAKGHEAAGIQSFCVVTSGETLNTQEFERVLETFRKLNEETDLNLDGSLGILSAEQIKLLKEAGMRRFNHNLQCSRAFYPKIVSTHSYDERMETLNFLGEQGVEICSGGIFGMGETREDRIKLAFELKPYTPHCLPINILNPRPGTPLQNQQPLSPLEIIKTIAIFRFIHPKTNIKLAGGRELNLGIYFQEKALRGGANGLVVGGYLTTAGNPIQEDLDMLERTGFSVESSKEHGYYTAAQASVTSR